VRHAQEHEARIAREEALSAGSFFGPGPIEIGMQLEDKEYEGWRKWADKEIMALQHLNGSAYTGTETEEAGFGESEELESDALQEISESVPGSRRGQDAMGGSALHP